MSATRYNILAPTRYPWQFNGPRNSFHHIKRGNFIPFNYLNPKLEGITIFNPIDVMKADLIHAFNRIPLNASPFIISFESHLPRAFGMEGKQYFRRLTSILESERCKLIVGISEHATKLFRKQHSTAENWGGLSRKLTFRYPNVAIPEHPDRVSPSRPDCLKIIFVGNHFARKGGCVAVKVAELAKKNSFPIELNIVSKLEVGGAIWTDPGKSSFFDQYLELLNLDNVRLHRQMPNAAVLELLGRSNFSVLTTFGDTFGYSALESMANYTPVLATRQGALSEFIIDGANGFCFDLETSEYGEWIYSSYGNRNSTEFEEIFASEVDRLSARAFEVIVSSFENWNSHLEMRAAARRSAEQKFSAQSANAFWDDLYSDICQSGSSFRK